MRYIGSKNKLLEYIFSTVEKYCNLDEGSTICDVFAGTGAVGDQFQSKYTILANDNLYFSYCVNKAKLCINECSFKKLKLNPFEYFNNTNADDYIYGYCYNTFSPNGGRQYFSDENAKKIDFIRDKIDDWYEQDLISTDEKEVLIGCLIESVSKVSNVAGVYAACLHIWDSRALKKMTFIPVERINNPKYKNEVFNSDANMLIHNISGDLLYLDPPYTSTQYISQYHVLETIAKNDRPKHHGVGAHRDNGNQISKWSKKIYVPVELYKLIGDANFKYIAMSYSDAGILSKEFITSVFKRFCDSKSLHFEKIDFVKYKNTRAVNKEKRDNTKNNKHYEWFFLGEKKKPLFISPLNYIGGKYDILDFLLPKFPNRINTFYDLFGGGGTLSVNAVSRKVVYNDINYNVTNLLKYITEHDPCEMYDYITKTIKKNDLSKGNKESYVKFRNYYNSQPIEKRNPLDLYILICFGFEHQIRFNSKMEFNNPCGNSGFNDEMLEKLISYSLETKKKNMTYISRNYLDFESEIKEDDFVYCDPPYLLTCGAYNDGKRGFNGWDENQQNELLCFLDRLDDKNVKFALSYIIDHDERTNSEIKKWVENKGYNLYINPKLTKRNRQDRFEALITNYEVKNDGND
ncbi:Dam family site-specific DNA-(adenine-N6)-methyltransferase [Mycoplasmopsis arginini]|uniref:Dam family site-specific DNA-(adenine-N6)-methyltransferase n=1 Tax=Mycoplasmopsis arginini TaxID=2094 RepID=UPI00249F629F|nr:Dam family site-specific DNA-(adenine-N6)-methyltransferase [Mycoplasmopsis arginini]MDI3348257.1 Modification methylase FokI [Mycoplasmopsis arginini]